MTDDDLIAEVRRNFPRFAVHQYRVLGEGWMSRALLVNETHVFRFAKRPDASADLEIETALLPMIARHVRLQVPRFELTGRQQSGLGFVGYPIIRGEALEQKLFAALTHTAAQAVVADLAQFMDAVGSVPLELARSAGLEPIDYRARCARDLQRVESFLPQLSQAVRAYVERRYQEFLECPAYAVNAPRLLHADLSPDHLLFDPGSEKLVGVIDFGDLSLGDPDCEYLYLLEDLGADFAARVMEARGERDVPALLRKVGYYVTFGHVRTIVGGLERREPSFVEEGVAALVAEASSRG